MGTVFSVSFFTLWTLCINKDDPGHNSFEYETNMLSFVSVKNNNNNNNVIQRKSHLHNQQWG